MLTVVQSNETRYPDMQGMCKVVSVRKYKNSSLGKAKQVKIPMWLQVTRLDSRESVRVYT